MLTFFLQSVQNISCGYSLEAPTLAAFSGYIFLALDKWVHLHNIFFYFSTKSYVVGTH